MTVRVRTSRRQFVRVTGCAALAFPWTARAQRSDIPTIGFLHATSPAPQSSNVAAFKRGLGETGFVEGKNVAIEYRWAEGRFDRLPELAADLVRRRVSVIVTPGNTSAALAARAATQTIPIVFGVSEDPVKFKLVASLARPGGNATGINYFATEIVAKRLQLLHELVPGAARVAALINPANAANAETTSEGLLAAAREMGLQVRVLNASTANEIDAAFVALARERPDAIFIAPDSYYNARRDQIVGLAERNAIPAVYSVRSYVDAGGLMSYGPSIAEMFRAVGAYAGRILQGEKPNDLPVFQLTKLELAINLKAAKKIGLAVPESILLRADEVVE